MKRLIAIALCAAAAQAAAQTVWRCGAEGRTFQSAPCADGRPVAMRPPPDAAALAEARAVVAREQLALQTLAAQRRERERQALGAGGIALPAVPAPKSLRPSRPAPEACGTSPSAARASPRDPAARGCS
jgi:hypothetical protein